jgi:hypothetical protein
MSPDRRPGPGQPPEPDEREERERKGHVQETTVVPVQSARDGWASAEAAGEDLARVPVPDEWEISLDVTEGEDRGLSFRVTRSRVLIGRGDVEIALSDSHVSRRHASLEVYGAACVLLKDLGSTNGTLVNGRRVAYAELSDGDVIEVGSTHLSVTIGAR